MHGAAGSLEMKSIEHYRKNFLNYLNDTLSDQAKAEFEAALSESKELQTEIENYRRVVQMEEETAKENFELDERFVSRVMAEIKYNRSLFSRILMEFKSPSRRFAAGVGGFAVIALCLSLAYGPAYEEYKLRNANLETAVQDSSIPELSRSTSIESEESLTSPEVPLHSSEQEALEPRIQVHKVLPDHLAHLPQELLELDSSDYFRPAVTDSMMRRSTTQTNEMSKWKDLGAGRIRAKRGLLSDSESYHRLLPLRAERHTKPGENSPILTSTEPMSTFSIDVDTESYTNARRFLQQGKLPPAETVRIEEFINYFDYDYTLHDNQPFATSFEVAPSPGYEGAHLFKIGIRARESLSTADVKLQIEFNPEHVAQYRLIGYEPRAFQNQHFANDRTEAEEIRADHAVTALYEILLTGSKAAEGLSPMYRYKQEEKIEKAPTSSFTDELAFLKISYKQPEGGESTTLTFPLSHSKIKNDLSQASDDFLFAAAVSAFAHKLRRSRYAPELTFDQVVELATKGKGQDQGGVRQEFIELVKAANALNRR